MKIRMKKALALLLGLALLCSGTHAQDTAHFRKIVKDLSSARFQGRGYARDGVVKAGKYIESEFRKAGAEEVTMQPFTQDVNTFPGKVRLWIDGRRMQPGSEFVMREYSPGVHGEGRLYYIDTLNYDGDRIIADLCRPENEGCFVVCDFWFTYKHSADFKKMQTDGECLNAGLVYTWDTPLKFYKAYANRVVDKPIIWVPSSVLNHPDGSRASQIRADIDNEFLTGYESSNVIAKVSGVRHDSCYVFIAHYDHLGNFGRRLYFPGANDNASGTAAIITMAEYYAVHKPMYDMYFIALSGEDTGLNGSAYFVEHPVMPLESIRYVFNFDMIGDNNPVQYCEVSPQGLAGFRQMEAINAQKSYLKGFNLGELAANSDHWSFAQKGVPCIMFENEGGEAFPHYHTAQDNMTTMRFETYEPLMNLVKDFISGYDK